MAYADADDLKLRFGQDVNDLLDRNGDGNDTSGLADAVLSEASSEIDAIIGIRYAVPVANVPYIKGACCDIARYRLYDDHCPDIVKERYEQAVEHLRYVAAGKADLISDSGEIVTDRDGSKADGGGAVYNKPRDERIFTDQSLNSFMGP